MNIAGKTILITGANRGIGRALVAEALQRGAKRIYAATRGPAEIQDERVTPLLLDVTKPEQIEAAAAAVESLDLLVNNAGVAIYDDLTNSDVVRQHLNVNVLGVLDVTNAFLPLLKRSRGAIVNHISLAGLAPLPMVPSYSISKAAALNLTQGLRMLLAGHGVSVHSVILGPIDTEMSRDFPVPKIAPAAAAKAIFDGVAIGEADIFPDPASQSISEGWRNGVGKALEGQFAAFVSPATAAA
jgi:NAD(P)-dependent dehydrogenase (short-subunit alcohol dehydrogenase family)